MKPSNRKSEQQNLNTFSATIELIGVNPFVFIPVDILENIFIQANKNRGKIPVLITIDGHSFIQTLIKYSGHWRLYLITPMRKAAKKEVGDTATFTITYDPEKREIIPHPKLVKALAANKNAKEIFDHLSPSLRLEIVRYISFLKTEESVDKNVSKAIDFLLGRGKFIGRPNP